MCTIERYNLIVQSRTTRTRKNASYVERIDKYPLIRLPFIFRLHLETKDKDTQFVDLYLNPDELKEKIYFPLTRVLNRMLDYSITTIENHIHTEELAYYRLPDAFKKKWLRQLVETFGCDMIYRFLFIIDNDEKMVIKPELSIKFLFFKYKIKKLQPREFIMNKRDAKTLVKTLESLI